MVYFVIKWYAQGTYNYLPSNYDQVFCYWYVKPSANINSTAMLIHGC